MTITWPIVIFGVAMILTGIFVTVRRVQIARAVAYSQREVLGKFAGSAPKNSTPGRTAFVGIMACIMGVFFVIIGILRDPSA
jgi:amino acid transporter